MQVISNIALISINETMILQVVSFLIFLFIINRIMFRPMRNVMNERKAYIDRIQQDVVKARDQFEALTNQVQVREKGVRNEAFEQKKQLEDSGSRQAADILASTREEIDALKADAQKEIDQQITEARKHVQDEAEGLAQKIMAKILYRSLD